MNRPRFTLTDAEHEVCHHCGAPRRVGRTFCSTTCAVRSRHAARRAAGSDEQRFWSHVDRRGGDECWPWTGALNDGYGAFRALGKSYNASRFAWEITQGDPGDLYVLHRCDNRRCCNPDHLFLGSARDNALDMVSKGRGHQQQKTHCPHGHEYTPGNVMLGQHRKCRTCDNLRQRERYKRMRAS